MTGLHPFILHLSRIPLAHDDSSPGNNDLINASRYSSQLNDTRRHQDVRGPNSQQKRIHITYPQKNITKPMSIFSKIANGEIPSYKCAENDKFYAFLDINPLQKGHTLVIPRREVDYIFDMEDDEIAEFQVFAKRVAIAIKKAFPCIKVGQAVLGLEVPHAHIHLVPMQSERDMIFSNPKLKLTPEEFEAIAAKIRENFE